MPSSKFPDLPAGDVAAEQRREQIAQIRDYFTQLHRVDTIAFRLWVANRADCKEDLLPQIGIIAATPRSLPRKYRSFAAEALGLRWVRATVISVVEGSPAALAGIAVKDELMSFNNEPVPVTSTQGWIEHFLHKNGENPVTIVFKHDGEDRTVEVTPVMGCGIPIHFEVATEVNAVATPSKITINSAMARVARTDDQLAAIVGHELAHVTMGHLDKGWWNTTMGQMAGATIDGGFLLGGVYTGTTFTKHFGMIGARAYSVDFEREADYVGAYYAVRAGYKLEGAEEVWAAMSLENPASLTSATTHPISAVRFLQMRKTAEEIADKQRRGLPLVPELKSMPVDTTPKRDEIH